MVSAPGICHEDTHRPSHRLGATKEGSSAASNNSFPLSHTTSAKEGEGEKLERRPGRASDLPSEEDGEKSNQSNNSSEADGGGEKDCEKGAAFGLRLDGGVEEVSAVAAGSGEDGQGLEEGEGEGERERPICSHSELFFHLFRDWRLIMARR
jgi:hypothetical protein